MKRKIAMILCALSVFAAYADDGQDLIEAVRRQDLAAVKAKLAAGVDVNAVRDKSVEFMTTGETPLILASTYGFVEGTAALLAAGADPNITNEGYSALRYAAGETGKLSIVKLLVEAGAKIDFQDPDGITALMCAASYERADIVRYLLLKGARKDLKDSYGNTAEGSTKNEDIKKLLR